MVGQIENTDAAHSQRQADRKQEQTQGKEQMLNKCEPGHAKPITVPATTEDMAAEGRRRPRLCQ